MNNTLLRTIYNYFTKNVLLTYLIIASPHFFVILIFTDQSVFFLNTTLVYLVVCAITFFTFLFLFGNKYNDKVKDNGITVLSTLLDSVNSITYSKFDRFKKYIQSEFKPDNNHFERITQPELQIEIIFNKIREALSKTAGISKNEIGVSILYKFKTSDIEADDQEKETWKWIPTSNIGPENLSLTEIVENKNSTAYHLLNRDRNLSDDIIFFPDKRVGIYENKYITDEKDKKFDSKGSILCKDLSIIRDSHYGIISILSVTTYGIQLCHQKDHDTINFIENLIVSCYSYRLRLELTLLFMKSLNNNSD